MITIFFYTAILVSIIGLITATYTDLKARIVPNTLNYGLALAGLLIFATQSYFESSPLPFLYSLLGMFFGFSFGWILWKIGVFAGGDAKLMIGLGGILPISGSFTGNLNLFVNFFLLFLIFGALYGILVSLYLGIKNYSNFKKEFFKEIKSCCL
jgi:preflagellin peptidase FlaK